MSKGLGKNQRAILELFDNTKRALRPIEIAMHLFDTSNPGPAEFSAVSKSLAKLRARGLADSNQHWMWSRPEIVWRHSPRHLAFAKGRQKAIEREAVGKGLAKVPRRSKQFNAGLSGEKGN